MADYRIYIHKNQPDQLGADFVPVNIVGVGTLKTYTEPDNFELRVSQELISLGWGVSNLKLSNVIDLYDKTQWLRAINILGALAPTWNYSISITINATKGDNMERIKQGIGNHLSNYFDDLRLDVSTASSSSNTGFLNSFGTALGVSTGVSTPLVIGGLVILAVIFLRR